MTIRLLIADDHAKVHMAIAQMISRLDDIEIVGQANDGEQAVNLCGQVMPDVVLMDVIMPGMDGIEATYQIKQQHPAIKVLALSSFKDDETVRAMLQAGALGYVLKDASINDIAHSIRAAHAGQSILAPEVIQMLLQPQGDPGAYDLTEREIEVLKLMVEGLNNKEIADKLFIGLSTAKFHVSNVLSKLGVSSRIEAVSLAVAKKLVS
jgi:two-component system, NarL family, response regulator LiaR